MIPTPKLGHLSAQDWEHVYEPAEDTFILLDALENDAEDLKKMGALTCLEVGSGSGCVSAFLGSILGASNAFYLCTDINSRAVDATLRTGVHNNVPLSPVLTSLTQSLLPRLKSKVDILLFNPPYVPTEHEELASAQVDSGISGAWAGGSDGMELTNLLLDNVGDLLSETGRFYLVGVKQNEPEGIKRRMFEGFGLYGEVLLQRRAGRENLFVLRFLRRSSATS
ncbi:S-adenosylmethionine-dependent methyltransferase [Tulasnella sp. 418]|nr:S-adenosylmethionine-dependent methyltransferase [Tulasnella sp. 418]